MKKFTLCLLVISVGVLLFVSPMMAQQIEKPVEPIITVATVHWLSDDSVVEGAQATLTRMQHGISMSLDTSGLEPDEVYTVWWYIFNTPENCTDSVCGANDVFKVDSGGNFILDAKGQRQLDRASVEAVQASAMWAAGSIAFHSRTAHFEGHLPIGDSSGNVWFGPYGLLDPMKPVIHLIVRAHGPADPGDMLQKQLYMFDGGACPNPINDAACKNIQSAVFEVPE